MAVGPATSLFHYKENKWCRLQALGSQGNALEVAGIGPRGPNAGRTAVQSQLGQSVADASSSLSPQGRTHCGHFSGRAMLCCFTGEPTDREQTDRIQPSGGALLQDTVQEAKPTDPSGTKEDLPRSPKQEITHSRVRHQQRHRA